MTKPTNSSRFLDAARHIVSVPKAEIDRREAAWKKQRSAKKSSK